MAWGKQESAERTAKVRITMTVPLARINEVHNRAVATLSGYSRKPVAFDFWSEGNDRGLPW